MYCSATYELPCCNMQQLKGWCRYGILKVTPTTASIWKENPLLMKNPKKLVDCSIVTLTAFLGAPILFFGFDSVTLMLTSLPTSRWLTEQQFHL